MPSTASTHHSRRRHSAASPSDSVGLVRMLILLLLCLDKVRLRRGSCGDHSDFLRGPWSSQVLLSLLRNQGPTPDTGLHARCSSPSLPPSTLVFIRARTHVCAGSV